MAKKRAKSLRKTSAETLKAIQVAFDLSGDMPNYIREVAGSNGLTPSDQIRKIVGLPYRPPKRLRLSISLSDKDYEYLGNRYGVPASDRDSIRERIREELEQFYESSHKKR